jgi:hypothetical protein
MNNNVMIGGIGATKDSISYLESNGREYLSIPFKEKGNSWVVMFSWGKKLKGVKNSYVTVRKVTNNPFGTLGKQFNDIDEAIKQYKSPGMISNLAQAESIAKTYGYE